MAKDRKKVLHIHSSVIDKQPTPASIEFGELAVNNAKDNAFISTKNSDGQVVRFSEDGTIIDWIEMKEVFPYEGYVRGNDSSLTGITETDLLENKSNIIVKINQVAARNSEYNEKVNNAKDIYGNPINPISADGYRDGAGIAIDMSNYAMQGANPSFSSITNTCRTTLNGTTIIRGLDGSCGSLLDSKVATEIGDFGIATNMIGTANTTISGDTTLVVSGNTTEEHNGLVSITNNNTKAETTVGLHTVNNNDNYIVNTSGDTHLITTINTTIHSDGKVDISANGDLSLVSSENNIIITANEDICETANNKASFYGINQTNIGLNCNDSDASTITKINGDTTIISGDTNINTFTNINTTASTETHNTTSFTLNSIDACIVASNKAGIGGNIETNIGADCEGNIISDNTFINASNNVAINALVTNISGNTIIDGELTITGTGLSTKLSWTYDDVCNATSDETNFKDDKTFKIPSSAAHIKRETLSWSYGDVRSMVAGAYDPGSNTSENCTRNSDNSKITIPKSIDHLDEWNGDCFTIPHNLCVDGTITAGGSIYSTSDERKKKDIQHIALNDKLKVRNIPLKSFEFIDDPKRKVYGVIAQEVQTAGLDELVHVDEEGMLSVDYTSFLILRIAYLENLLGHMHTKIAQLEEKINKK